MHSNSEVSLRHLLLTNSLTFNPLIFRPNPSPDILPPTYSTLLSTLRERLTRFRNFTPKVSNTLEFEEPEGRLYEYLEGILMRGVGGRDLPREIAFYDLRKIGDWEDDVEVASGVEEEEADEVRKVHKFDFEVAEFAVDPGMDLLVIAEVRCVGESPMS
jgi:hypothetical protein